MRTSDAISVVRQRQPSSVAPWVSPTRPSCADSTREGGNEMAGVPRRLTSRWADRSEREERAELLSALDHELRTPLTTIRGFAELLLDDHGGPLSTTQREMLQRIAASAERLGTTIEQHLPGLCGLPDRTADQPREGG